MEEVALNLDAELKQLDDRILSLTVLRDEVLDDLSVAKAERRQVERLLESVLEGEAV